MSIKGTIISEHPYVISIFGSKKRSLVKIGPQNGGFSET